MAGPDVAFFVQLVFTSICMPVQFGKRTLFLISNAVWGFIIAIYLMVWLLGGVRTVATITKPAVPQLQLRYIAGNTTYTTTHLRYGVGYDKTAVPLIYLRWRPGSSRVHSFLGLAAEPLGWWGIYLTASAMLLLSNNTVFSKGTRFTLHRRFPFISMDEFFPAAPNRFSFRTQDRQPKNSQHTTQTLSNKKQ